MHQNEKKVWIKYFKINLAQIFGSNGWLPRPLWLYFLCLIGSDSLWPSVNSLWMLPTQVYKNANSCRALGIISISYSVLFWKFY